jgi:hypothetical protein
VANLTLAFRTAATLRWWPLYAAANHLLYRHPALRTRYPQEAGVPLRHLSAAADVRLRVDTQAVAEPDIDAVVARIARHPIDLATKLPLRVALLNVDTGGSVVVLSTHHIVSDAASLNVLVGELAACYDAVAAADPIPAPLADPLPLRDEPEVPADHLRYWRDQLADVDPTAMVLSWARPSPVHPTFAGGTVPRRLTPAALAAIDALRQRLNLTENLVLLTAYYLMLFRHGAGPDMVVGVPITVRKPGDAGMGFGVSTLPLRLSVDRTVGFRQLSRTVRDAFLAGAMHAGASVEAVIAELGHRRPTGGPRCSGTCSTTAPGTSPTCGSRARTPPSSTCCGRRAGWTWSCRSSAAPGAPCSRTTAPRSTTRATSRRCWTASSRC